MKPTFLLCISVIILLAQSCSSSNPVSPTSFTLTAVTETEATATAPASAVEATQTVTPAVTEAPSAVPTEVPFESHATGEAFTINNYVDTSGVEIVPNGEYSSHTIGNIYAITKKDYPDIPVNLIPIQYFCQTGAAGPLIQATDRPDGSTRAISLSGTTLQFLVNNYITNELNGVRPANGSIDGFVEKLVTGFPVPFYTQSPDKMQNWTTNNGYTVFQVSLDSVKDQAGFIKINWVNGALYLKTTLDKSGKLIFVIASDSQNPYNSDKRAFSEIFFMGLNRVLDNPNQTREYYVNKQMMNNKFGQIGDAAVNESVQELKVTDLP